MLLGELFQETGPKTLVMGILNITEDSFYDGGKFTGSESASAHAQFLIENGADILDVGGESSRPGAEPVPPDEERTRVLPVVERLSGLGCPISVDTRHAETARQALALGARMINDITALRDDPAMAETIAEAHCDCVLMHMLGTPRTMQNDPQYSDVVDDIRAFFEERMNYAVQHDVAEEALWLDPGFGFGKTVQHNLEILRRLGEFKQLGRPILVGTSNKSTVGAILDAPVHDRTEGTAATVAIAVWNGADAIRVHDVKAMARVAKMTDAIAGRQHKV